jgi:hypothetical protein
MQAAIALLIAALLSLGGMYGINAINQSKEKVLIEDLARFKHGMDLVSAGAMTSCTGSDSSKLIACGTQLGLFGSGSLDSNNALIISFYGPMTVGLANYSASNFEIDLTFPATTDPSICAYVTTYLYSQGLIGSAWVDTDAPTVKNPTNDCTSNPLKFIGSMP